MVLTWFTASWKGIPFRISSSDNPICSWSDWEILCSVRITSSRPSSTWKYGWNFKQLYNSQTLRDAWWEPGGEGPCPVNHECVLNLPAYPNVSWMWRTNLVFCNVNGLESNVYNFLFIWTHVLPLYTWEEETRYITNQELQSNCPQGTHLVKAGGNLIDSRLGLKVDPV